MQYSGAGLITNEFVQKFIFSDVFTFLKSDLRLLRGIFSQKTFKRNVQILPAVAPVLPSDPFSQRIRKREVRWDFRCR